MNNLHFEVQVKKGKRSDYPLSVMTPKKYPSFILVHNDDWNDYCWYTWFSLFYFPDPHERFFIGELKLLFEDGYDTYDALEESFDSPLSEKFCSLGIDSSYYKRMKEILGEDSLVNDVLRYLRDCTVDYQIYEKFCNEEGFISSLMRDLSSEKAFKEAKFLLTGRTPSDAYSFEFTYRPVYNPDLFAKWQVHFDYDTPLYMRCTAIIGENGVGKTMFLRQLITELLKPETDKFNRTPLYNCCIAISSSSFDGYEALCNQTTRINYYPCSLVQEEDRIIEDLKQSINTIEKRPTVHQKSMMELYMELLQVHLGEWVKDLFLKTYNEDKFSEDYSMDMEKLEPLIPILSSGQLHLLSMITHICANIHFSSLFVIDEPEVHLHPKTMMDFMTLLCDILNKFESFAVIATHSPLIVRELVNRNVYLMQTVSGGIPTIAPVVFDTFGEDVTTLYRRIFGYDESNSFFRNLVESMIKEGKNDEEIVDELGKHISLSLNARFTIRDMFNEWMEEQENA